MTRRDALRSPSRERFPGPPPDPDTEFVGGAWDEAAPPSLDFDDESASRDLHAREPEDDFATLDEDGASCPGLDAADLADRVGRDVGAGEPDAWDDEPDGGPPRPG